MSQPSTENPPVPSTMSRRAVLGVSAFAVPAVLMTANSPLAAASPTQRTVAVAAPSNSVSASGSTPVTTTVTSQAGAPVAGSAVSLTGPAGSSFAAANGTTDGSGMYSTTFALNTPWAYPGSTTTVTAVSDSTAGTGAFTVLGANMLMDQGPRTEPIKQAPTQFSSPIVHAQCGPGTEVVLLQDGTVWKRDFRTDNPFVKVDGITGGVDLASSIRGIGTFWVLKNDGTVWGWGNNEFGQLDDGTTTDRTTPVQAQNLSNVTKMAAARGVLFALKSDNTLWAVGNNENGAAGVGTVSFSVPLTQVSGGVNVIDVAARRHGGAFVKTDGTVWSWGEGANNNIGDGQTIDRPTPVQLTTLSGITGIDSGITAVDWTAWTMYARTSTGTVYTWGSNARGAYGDNTTTTSPTPIQIAGLTGVKQISTSTDAVIALKTDGTLSKWGYGASTPTTYTPNRPIIRLGNASANAFNFRVFLITS